MSSTPRARRNPALALLAVAASTAALVVTTMSLPASAAPVVATAAAAPTAAVAKAPAKHSRKWRAKAALARATKAFTEGVPSGERPDATMALRDLALLKSSLSPADRAAADRLSNRPKKPATLADENLVLHYDPAEVKYDVNQAFATLQNVANTYAASGYRRPKSDRGRGGDNRIDIYLDNLQPGFYGFCTTDQNVKASAKKFDVWAYCVLDPDYEGFPRTPIENFTVTAAHEYFHAVQFAYDIREDPWLLEATAAWAEDQLYDTINDNFQYLDRSPITMPGRSIDKFEGNGTFHYGVWNFFRYLTEKYPTPVGPMPGLMLSIIDNTDSSKGLRKNLYSTEAVDKALKSVGTSLAEQFALYSAATRYTHQSFSEGVELNYPVKGAASASVAGGQKAKGKTKLDHLTSRTFNFVNAGGASQLSLKVRMGQKRTGSRAVAVLYGAGGVVTGVQPLSVNKKGKGKLAVPFDPSVTSVDLTVVNAGTKFKRCFTRLNVPNPISCYGDAVYDNVRARVKVKAS